MVNRVIKDENDQRALREAVLLVGSASILAAMIGVSPSQVKNWLSRGDEANYKCLIRIAKKTGVSPERLSSLTQDINGDFINPGLPIEARRKKLIIRDLPYLEDYRLDRLMIVGTNRWLISGLTQLKTYEIKGSKQVTAMAIDLEALLFERRSLKNMTGNFNFLNSERIAIALCLDQLLESLRGKWSDLRLEPGLISHYSKLYQNPIEREKHIARVVGFNSVETYQSIKQAYLSGDKKLIEPMDGHALSIEAPIKPLLGWQKFFQKRKELCLE